MRDAARESSDAFQFLSLAQLLLQLPLAGYIPADGHKPSDSSQLIPNG
jgi:hypothetical protein